MATCSSCAKEFPDGAKFCPECGAARPPSAPELPADTASPAELAPVTNRQGDGPPPTNYTTPAVITMVLYFLLWVPGLVANLAYLSSAGAEKRRTGEEARGVGCLKGLIVGFAILPAALLAAACSSPSPVPAPVPFAQIGASATATAIVSATDTVEVPTARPATVSAAPTVAQAAGTYTVKAGDTLAAIAASVGSSVPAIAAVNPGVNSNTLHVGQELRLPTGSSTHPAPATGPTGELTGLGASDATWSREHKEVRTQPNGKPSKSGAVYDPMSGGGNRFSPVSHSGGYIEAFTMNFPGRGVTAAEAKQQIGGLLPPMRMLYSMTCALNVSTSGYRARC